MWISVGLGFDKKHEPWEFSPHIWHPKSHKLHFMFHFIFTSKAHEVGTFTSKWDFAKWNLGHNVKQSLLIATQKTGHDVNG